MTRGRGTLSTLTWRDAGALRIVLAVVLALAPVLSSAKPTPPAHGDDTGVPAAATETVVAQDPAPIPPIDRTQVAAAGPAPVPDSRMLPSISGGVATGHMPCHGGARMGVDSASTTAAAGAGPDPVPATGNGPVAPAFGEPATDMPACPHCSGDSPASACHCCGCTAPAGLALPVVATHPDPGRRSEHVAPRADSIPQGRAEPLFRPPIRSS